MNEGLYERQDEVHFLGLAHDARKDLGLVSESRSSLGSSD
jgi:hypothetical protein